MKRERHTWTIDVIEENSAAIEVDGRQVTPLPRWLLPEDAREGDVLTVRHERTRERSSLTIRIDREAREEAMRRSAEQVGSGGSSDRSDRSDASGAAGAAGADRARKRDPGGDVAL